jgi:hypothetical protein
MSVRGHHGDDGRQAAVANREPHGVRPGRGQAAAGVPQHRRGNVDAERSPAQVAHAPRAHAGAAADLQAGASPPAQQAAQRGIDAEPIGPRRGDTGQELLLIPVRDLVISRRRHRGHLPGSWPVPESTLSRAPPGRGTAPAHIADSDRAHLI